MDFDAAELSSVQHTLERLAEQVVRIADRRDALEDDPVAPALFEVDRSLRAAIRRLEQVGRQLS